MKKVFTILLCILHAGAIFSVPKIDCGELIKFPNSTTLR